MVRSADEYQLGINLQYIRMAAKELGRVKGEDYILDTLKESLQIIKKLNINGKVQKEIENWIEYLDKKYRENDLLSQQDSEPLFQAVKIWRGEVLNFLQGHEYPDLYEMVKRIENFLYRGQTSTVSMLVTSSQKKEIREKMKNIIESCQKGEKLFIVTPYLGTPLLDTLLVAIERGVEIQIITRSPRQKDKEVEKSFKDLHKKLKDNVKILNILHSRFFIREDKEVIISSADLKSDSLETNYEAGIWTNIPALVSDAINFFNLLWEEAEIYKS